MAWESRTTHRTNSLGSRCCSSVPTTGGSSGICTWPMVRIVLSQSNSLPRLLLFPTSSRQLGTGHKKPGEYRVIPPLTAPSQLSANCSSATSRAGDDCSCPAMSDSAAQEGTTHPDSRISTEREQTVPISSVKDGKASWKAFQREAAHKYLEV